MGDQPSDYNARMAIIHLVEVVVAHHTMLFSLLGQANLTPAELEKFRSAHQETIESIQKIYTCLTPKPGESGDQP